MYLCKWSKPTINIRRSDIYIKSNQIILNHLRLLHRPSEMYKHLSKTITSYTLGIILTKSYVFMYKSKCVINIMETDLIHKSCTEGVLPPKGVAISTKTHIHRTLRLGIYTKTYIHETWRVKIYTKTQIHETPTYTHTRIHRFRLYIHTHTHRLWVYTHTHIHRFVMYIHALISGPRYTKAGHTQIHSFWYTHIHIYTGSGYTH